MQDNFQQYIELLQERDALQEQVLQQAEDLDQLRHEKAMLHYELDNCHQAHQELQDGIFDLTASFQLLLNRLDALQKEE